ncbi:glucan endo-1,3-beta-glucosidase 1 [Tanacetum coccineum]
MNPTHKPVPFLESCQIVQLLKGPWIQLRVIGDCQQVHLLGTLNHESIIKFYTKETGWPSKGDSKEPYAIVDNANTYNSNLIKYIFDRSGIPFHPEYTSSVYIYELFNEELRSSPVSEANWGLFYANSTLVYLLHVSGIGEVLANDSTNQTYCVATDGVDGKTLQTALDWAWGPGRANCSEIQPEENCYQPNNVKNHASYAFDSYYEKQGRSAGSYDFKGVAMITTTDPSSAPNRCSVVQARLGVVIVHSGNRLGRLDQGLTES